MLFSRSINFTVPGTSAAPGLNILAVEDELGGISFTIDVLDTAKITADLRGLFFDVANESKLAGMAFAGGGGLIKQFSAAANSVIDLGNGNNLSGARSGKFDVGLEFGEEGIGKGKADIHDPVTFTLSNAAHNLTLDDIAQTLFGVRETSVGSPTGSRNDSAKLTFIAPAAPDAVADRYTIFEDGKAGLTSPSHVPSGVIFTVLANDTDKDGDTLHITDVVGAQHGSTQIVHGASGDYILYTPVADYAGPDGFTYAISDNHGGTDFAVATITVTPVADVPTVTYSIAAGDIVNQIKLTVTATQTDADASEYIDKIALSGLPGGAGYSVSEAVYDPASQTGSLTREFIITLPANTDVDFVLGITATSKEGANGDTEIGTNSLHVVNVSTFTDQNVSFLAQDQSLWDNGTAFTFIDDRFLGIDKPLTASLGDSDFGIFSTGHLKTGFQSTLEFNGGEIDATAPYDIQVTSNFNKTTDVLTIDTGATLLSGASFNTTGPTGSYKLDFVFDANFGLKIMLAGDAVYNETLLDQDVTTNILDLDSSDLSFEVGLPLGFSLNFAWPNLLTSSSGDTSNPYDANGASNDFFGLNLDIDDLVTQLLHLDPNPFDLNKSFGIPLIASAGVSLEILDVDVGLGLNFLQSFEMALGSMGAQIKFENGVTQSYTIGSKLTVANASSYDTNHDGTVGFDLILDPQATMKNNTDLGFNFNWNFDILKGSYSYDIFLVIKGGDNFGPLVDLGGTIPIAAVDIYDKTFGLDFASRDLVFAA